MLHFGSHSAGLQMVESIGGKEAPLVWIVRS